MATLETLPFETLYQILSSLSSADLAHISCLSPHLRDVAEQLLYKAPYLPLVSGSGANRPSLQIFLQTLFTPGRETLTTYVCSLRVEWDRIPLPFLNFPPIQGTQLIPRWHQLPSLRFIEISGRNRCSDFLDLMMSYHHVLPSALPLGVESLREFRYTCILLPGILSLPSLVLQKSTPIRSIQEFNSSENRPVVRATNHTVTTSSMTNLTVSGFLQNSTLSFLLKDLTTITRFSYTACAPGDINFTPFMHVLGLLQNSLQDLHLHINMLWRHSLVTDEAFGGGSLRAWPFLQKLSCSLMPLLGKGQRKETLCLADVLPPSLQIFEIQRGDYWSYAEVAQHVIDLMSRKEAAVPALESLSLCGRSGSLDEGLTLACEAVSVKFWRVDKGEAEES